MNDFRFIVTGGAGLIGSNMVRELNRRGYKKILIVDHLGDSEKWKNLRDLIYEDYLEKEEFLYRLTYETILKQYLTTHVIHLGACSSTTETNASYLIENNFEYTKLLATNCIQSNISFVYASSAATYGIGDFGYDDTLGINPLKPLNMYGYSKHMFDQYAENKGWLSKITGIKYFNVFGFGEAHKGDMRSVVLKGYEQIKSTGYLNLFKSYKEGIGDGEQKRDFLYVKDAVNITLHLLFGRYAGLYNAGRGIAETWNQLAAALFKAMKMQVKINYIEMPDHLKGKYQYYTKAEMDKLLNTKYSIPFTTLEDAISEYVSLLSSE